jgi:serine/threonine protein phosphatase PrpC
LNQILSFFHRHDVLCLELPPEGVILDKTGRIRLAQFETLTEKGVPHEPLFLSDGYSAPELYKSGELHETADVFAIGALLYSLVVGLRLPTESWVVQPEPPFFYPEKVISPDLERVLRKALAFLTEDRYQTVGELKSALLELTHETAIRSAWRTDVGQWRDHNEDAVLVKEVGQGTIAGDTFRGLYIVADGMGGAEAGEIASQISITVVAQHIEQAWSQDRSDDVEWDDAAWEVCLREAVEAANTAIVGYAKAHPEAEGMGSTIVAVLLSDQSQILAWVGDSRIYLLEGGQLIQLSRDHSLVERLVEIGQLTPEEARTHEHRNVLIRSLGSKEQVSVDTLTRPFKRGARLLLCSDGLTSHVEDPALADILSRHREPRDAALELVVAANTGGGSDNVSVIVVFNE